MNFAVLKKNGDELTLPLPKQSNDAVDVVVAVVNGKIGSNFGNDTKRFFAICATR